jgi:DNA-binding MarR family transcriptional regulator
MENERDRIIREINKTGVFFSPDTDGNKLNPWIELDLTMGQLKSLFYIEFHDNVSIKDLSRTLKIAQPNVTNLVEFLVAEGLVSREENPEDRRMLLLKTTAKAKHLIAGLRNGISYEMSGYFDLLSLDELQLLADGLNPLKSIMQERRNGNNIRH